MESKGLILKSIKTLIKKTMAFFSPFLNRLNHGFGFIICYHQIGEEMPQSTSINFLKRQINFFEKHFKIIRIKDLRNHISTNESFENFVCLTFDDGYRTHFSQAARILENKNLRGTFFIPSGRINKQISVRDEEYRVRVMNKKQIRALHDKGHEIGSHSKMHNNLKTLSKDKCKKELKQSKEKLENIVGSEIVSFAYPFGLYCMEHVNLLREFNFKYGVSTIRDTITNNENFLELPRISSNNSKGLMGIKLECSPVLPFLKKINS